ncbi:DUF488 domain-containing protein [Luteolibacter algae]|uniref:DUF488 domain-containing protein n=1 Tax=Luteolibacter algae TaxID=454151 RepID=A0ABW5DB96_9BACT
MEIYLKRAYELASAEDGLRILVDRLWPRGVSKEDLKIDVWLKEIAPSEKLRKWFGHEAARWKEFQERYLEELEKNRSAMATLNEYISQDTVTLIYSARDAEHNHAIVLKGFLENQKKSG